MFGSKAKLRPMLLEHIPLALEIIASHDEDDAECAEESYAEGLEGQFVYQKGSTIYGITGYDGDFESGIATISWTYIHEDHRRQGHGEQMLLDLLTVLKKEKFRKVYVQTSDYREAPWQPMLYDGAIKLYQKLGFKQEAYHPHFYEQDEGMLIYGKRLKDRGDVMQHPSRENADGIEIFDIIQLEESDHSFALDWHEDGDGPLTPEAVEQELAKAKSAGAKQVFISFPSTYALNLYSIISNAGFREEAQLLDYYADGIHEVRYRVNLEEKPEYPTY